jgi:hypothetical protein
VRSCLEEGAECLFGVTPIYRDLRINVDMPFHNAEALLMLAVPPSSREIALRFGGIAGPFAGTPLRASACGRALIQRALEFRRLVKSDVNSAHDSALPRRYFLPGDHHVEEE